jgi:hypothetical protein
MRTMINILIVATIISATIFCLIEMAENITDRYTERIDAVSEITRRIK